MGFPTPKVEYSSSGAAPFTDATADLIEFEINLQRLVDGAHRWKVRLDNRSGRYDADTFFPRKPTETGLGYYFRFSVNTIVLLIGRAEEAWSVMNMDGETYEIHGNGLDQELLNLLVTKTYEPGITPDKLDDVIANVINTQIGATDVSFTSPSTGPVIIFSEYRLRAARDVILDLLEQQDPQWEAVVKSDAKPAPLQVFQVNDPTKRITGATLQYKPNDSTNNLLDFTVERDILSLKNEILLEAGTKFTGAIPEDFDLWTEGSALPAGWFANKGTLSMDGVDKAVGAQSVKCEGPVAGTGFDVPDFEFRLATSVYGKNFDVEDALAILVAFQYGALPSRNDFHPVRLRLFLEDDGAKQIYRDFPETEVTGGGISPIKPKFTGVSIPIGKDAEPLWTAVTGSVTGFTWKIAKIIFSDRNNVIRSGLGGAPKLWIDGLHFSAADPKAGQLVKTNTPSVARYGKRQVYFDASQHPEAIGTFGDRMLKKLQEPMSILRCTTLLDPAAANVGVLWPGYGIQVDVTTRKVDTAVFWRILETNYRFDGRGFTTSLVLTPAASETIDYSQLAEKRYRDRIIPVR